MMRSHARLRPRPPVLPDQDYISLPNVVPIAGVMLVIAGMLAMTYPMQTHALVFDLPAPFPPDWELTEVDVPLVEVGTTRDGTATWNGEAISREEFAARLAEARLQPVDPGVRFMPHAEAAYGDVIDLLAIIETNGLPGGRFCFGGIASYRQYDDFPLAPRPDLPANSPDCDPTRGFPLDYY